MVSFDEVEKFDGRLDKAEQNTLNRINRQLDRDFRLIERHLEDNYSRLRSDFNLLPDEKADSLNGRLNTTISNRDYSDPLRDFYNRVREQASIFNQDLIDDAIIPDNLNDPIDFWTVDGNNRIGDWSNRFIRDVRAISRLAFSQRWNKSTFLAAVRKRYGQLKSQIQRVITTGTSGVKGGTSDRFAIANNLKLEVFKTSGLENVCPYCYAREGNIYRVGEISIPLHPACQCDLIPIDKAMLKDKQFLQQLDRFQEEALKKLAAAGGKPNYGAAPFEKRAGATEPPKPVK